MCLVRESGTTFRSCPAEDLASEIGCCVIGTRALCVLASFDISRIMVHLLTLIRCYMERESCLRLEKYAENNVKDSVGWMKLWDRSGTSCYKLSTGSWLHMEGEQALHTVRWGEPNWNICLEVVQTSEDGLTTWVKPDVLVAVRNGHRFVLGLAGKVLSSPIKETGVKAVYLVTELWEAEDGRLELRDGTFKTPYQF